MLSVFETRYDPHPEAPCDETSERTSPYFRNNGGPSRKEDWTRVHPLTPSPRPQVKPPFSVSDKSHNSDKILAGNSLPGSWNAIHQVGAGLSVTHLDLSKPTLQIVKDL